MSFSFHTYLLKTIQVYNTEGNNEETDCNTYCRSFPAGQFGYLFCCFIRQRSDWFRRTDRPDRILRQHGKHRPDRSDGKYGQHRANWPDRQYWQYRTNWTNWKWLREYWSDRANRSYGANRTIRTEQFWQWSRPQMTRRISSLILCGRLDASAAMKLVRGS